MFPLVLHLVPLLEPKQDSRANAEPYVRGGLLTKGSICVHNLRAQDGLARAWASYHVHHIYWLNIVDVIIFKGKQSSSPQVPWNTEDSASPLLGRYHRWRHWFSCEQQALHGKSSLTTALNMEYRLYPLTLSFFSTRLP